MIHDPIEDIKSQLSKKAVILDVRTPEEFEEGHMEGTVNIPLHEVPDKIAELKESNAIYIAVCRSGNRSNQASLYMKSQGMDVVNGGPWDFLRDLAVK